MTGDNGTHNTPKEDTAETDLPNTSRRRFLQATGGASLAGLVGISETVTAQDTGEDAVIKLEADHTGPPVHAGPGGNSKGEGNSKSKGKGKKGQNGRGGPPENAGPPNHAGHARWVGISPDEIAGESNPTLSLIADKTYTIEWTNTRGRTDNFVIVDGKGNEIKSSDSLSEKGATQTVEFTATSQMAEYYSESHPNRMRGSISVDSDDPPEPSDDMLSVMFMGGPEDGSHNAPDRQAQISEFLQNRGIEVYYTDRQDDLLKDTLHRYDAWILFDNRSELTQAQEDSLISFVQEEGGGFIGIHSASACFTESDRFINHIGGQFQSHGYGEVTSNREMPDHPIFTGFDPIVTEDETYVHTNLNTDNNVIATATGPEFAEGTTPQPWTWVRQEGEGRIFYTAFGHGSGPWAERGFKKMIENAIRWTSGNEDTIAEDTRTLEPLQFTEADVPFYPGGATQQTVPPEVGSGTSWNMMQEPLSPDQTAARTITPEGFDIRYFVTEEILPDSIDGNILNMVFDERGRCYLALSQDYPNSAGENRDSIVICEDTDGDGQADEFTVFADGLSIPTAITIANGGVFVANLGQSEEEGAMLFLEDTNGDDQADEETVLFSGFDNGDTHASVNELKVGIDNWIWGQVGYSGFSGTVGGEEYDFASAVYRFRPDGSEFQIMGSLPGNQAGVGFDEEGLAFASAATAGQPSNYLAIPGPYYQYVNGVSSSGRTVNISDTNRFIHATDRIRQVDYHGGYTAATGQSFYTARSYPKKYWNDTAFVGDGTGHLLGTFWKEPDGASFTAHNANNIAASTDAWFSPTYSQVGPDGNLWLIDLYEYIFQHNPTPDGFDNGEGNAYQTPLREKQMTRLMRIEYGDDNSQQMDLGNAGPSALVNALSHDNMFWRQEAQRLLVERGEMDVVSDVVSVVQNNSPDELGIAKGAVHALWTLHGLGALEEGASSSSINAAINALGHSSAAVRLNSLRVLPGTAAVRDAILNNNLVTDNNMRVRMWAILALARTPSSDAAGQAIFQMIDAGDNIDDDLLREATLIGGATHAQGFISAYEDTYGGPPDDEPGEPPNVATNPGFEETADGGPAGWVTNTWGGSGTLTHDNSVSRSGEYSIRTESSEGGDLAWTQVREVEPNTEYRFAVYVKTGENFTPTSGFGATLNIHELGQDSLPDISGNAITESGQNWTLIETTFNSGDNDQLTFNCLYGGWGFATGQAWWDDVVIQPLGDIGEGIDGLYNRIQRHLELETGPTASFSASSTDVDVGTKVSFDASDSSTSGGSITSYEWEFGDGSTATGQTVSHTYDGPGDYTVTLTVTDDGGATATATKTITVGDGNGNDTIEPGTTITFDGYTGGWEATAPSAISGQTNPTLTLQEGAQYTLQFTNQDGAPHDIAVQDSGGNVLNDSGSYVSEVGATDSVDITASTEMATYVCTAHPTTMVGSIEVV